LWARQDAAGAVSRIRRTLDTGESYVTADDTAVRDAQGALAYYEWGADRVVGPDGRFGVICFFRDVTARKQDEETLRRSEQQLAEANRLKDEFLATLSHELRTPLNAILGWAHMLRTGTLRADTRERGLESLVRNARLQARLVDDLLDVSRIMSSNLAIKRETLDLTGVIAAAVDAMRPTAAAGDVQLRVGFDADDEVLVDGDAGRLQQVVSNLLSNAVKFTPARGTVDIDVRRAGASIELIVRDSGEGIDPAFLPHVFDRFRQGNSAASRRHGGLGLGLAIVRHLTEAHGGKVSAHSDGPGTGTTFVVTLPRAEHRRPARAAAHAPRQDGALGTIRVLVVDDEHDSRELVKFVLEGIGGDVTAVGSARDALRVLEQQRFDVLVADVGMPEQDGYSLMRAIRGGVPGGESIRAIAVSAYASLRDREEALAAGFDDHLGKPADPDRLLAAVAALARP
jgi:signal transduction histidine kinase